ncbi:hypothetical protein ACFQV8_08715 [Pseudonocardia benzenivorans]
MALRVGDHLAASLPALRHEPIARRVRAWSGGTLLLDSSRAALVWEPGRVVPQYAVPVDDVVATLTPDRVTPAVATGPAPSPSGPPAPRC